MIRLLLSLVAVAACASAQAQIYKCPDASGRTVIQQMPCMDGVELDVRPASGSGQSKSELSRAFQDLHQARMAEIERINADCDERGITSLQLGMDKADALCAPGWRFPDKTNTTLNASGVREQVVYSGPDRLATHRYLYFENGKLTSVQQ